MPEDRGRLYYGMTAPFVNYSVAGWLWYQGENNCGGVMGNSKDGVGYGCSLPAMINAWRTVWSGSEQDQASRLFGIATLAAGGSEGNGIHMGGMRWSQTANYGVKYACLSICILKHDRFTKTGSGQTCENSKRRLVSQGTGPTQRCQTRLAHSCTIWVILGAEMPFLRHRYTDNDLFAKTGSCQTQ